MNIAIERHTCMLQFKSKMHFYKHGSLKQALQFYTGNMETHVCDDV